MMKCKTYKYEDPKHEIVPLKLPLMSWLDIISQIPIPILNVTWKRIE